MNDVLITGLGIVSPIGIGKEAVAASLAAGRSGVRAIPEFAVGGWLAPYGGEVADFDPKQYVKPRKSLKVMAREIQFAFAAAELAWQDAGLEEGQIDPLRGGVVLGAGLMYCDLEELTAAYQACVGDGSFAFSRWGDQAVREFFPLWMLKYLPNMPACHIGIRHDLQGPTNTIAHGSVSSLLAVSEAAEVIRRGHAEVMLAGGTSTRLSISDLVWHGGARLVQSDASPETLSRPFDSERQGMVMGEGAALVVLESRRHAERRGAKPLARLAATTNRYQPTAEVGNPPGRAIEQALVEALRRAEITPEDLSHINAHGLGTREDDPIEAQAIAAVLNGADIPVTAPKSYFGDLGAGSGAVELGISLLAMQQRMIPATLNHTTTDPACPIRVAQENEPTFHRAFAALNHTATGQAAAAIIVGE